MILQKKDVTSYSDKESLLEKIKSSEKNIDLLLQWAIQTEQPLGWRAVWLLRQIIPKDDPKILTLIPKVLELFPFFSESQKREWLKTLEGKVIDEDQEGIIYDLCITEWKNIHNHAALRASAVSILFGILLKYPELKDELKHLMTNEYIETLTPGIQRGVLKSWKKNE